MAFSPRTVTVSPGDTVTWSFEDAMTHNATSNQGFWASGPRGAGTTYSRVFTSGGTFGYLCTIHPSMQGSVKVRLLATGSPTAGWVVRWASTNGTDGIDYDVQVRKPGSKAWKAFRTDTTGQTATFNPSRSGSYSFRARTAKDGTSSGWSPTKKLQVS